VVSLCCADLRQDARNKTFTLLVNTPGGGKTLSESRQSYSSNVTSWRLRHLTAHKQNILMVFKECSTVKRNLILSLALLAISVPNFALAKKAKPSDSSKQESSMQKADQQQKKKHKKEKKQRNEQQDNGGFSIYG
jgi:hypothetical protein